MNNQFNCERWFYVVMFLIFVILAVAVMIFRYFLKLDRNGVKLGQADKQHELKHKHNEQRIKMLETEISTLKGVIDTLTRTKNERRTSNR